MPICRASRCLPATAASTSAGARWSSLAGNAEFTEPGKTAPSGDAEDRDWRAGEQLPRRSSWDSRRKRPGERRSAASQCGCKADYYCDLRELATEYEVPAPAFRADRYIYPKDKSHPVHRARCQQVHSLRPLRAGLQHRPGGRAPSALRIACPPTRGPADPLLNTTCESCGQCVASCPVGALVAKNELRPEHEVKTICTYCGVGCSIYLGVRGDTGRQPQGRRGEPCEPREPLRQRAIRVRIHPLPRAADKAHSSRRTASSSRRAGTRRWSLVASKLGGYRGDQFAFIASAKCTNEENYLFQKFARGVMGTNSIDHCART